jgi:NAD(P)H-dependent FMN reductase
MLKIALIVGSTRPNRLADKVAPWVVEGARGRTDLTLEVLDLRDANLPLFNEPASPLFTGGSYSEPAAEAWRHRIGEFDGYICTVAEYNHGPTAALKNAFDSAYYEWVRKPVAFVGYGGVGGARAIEVMRGVAIELQMAPLKHEVNIGGDAFLGLLLRSQQMSDFPYLDDSRTLLFENLAWWGNALKAARAKA